MCIPIKSSCHILDLPFVVRHNLICDCLGPAYLTLILIISLALTFLQNDRMVCDLHTTDCVTDNLAQGVSHLGTLSVTELRAHCGRNTAGYCCLLQKGTGKVQSESYNLPLRVFALANVALGG